MFTDYARTLEQIDDPAERSRLIKTWAEQLRIDRKRMYQELAKAGWSSGRTRRSDAGETHVPPASLDYLATMMKSAVRQNGKSTMFIPVARQVAEANGISFNGVSNAYLARLLKERALDLETQKSSTKSHVRMRSLHPNHVHLVDPSLCLLYYLPGGEQRMERIPKKKNSQHIIEDSEAYKNKPFLEKKGHLKVWRYVLVDHRSGSLCVRYYQMPGESMVALWDFLMYAWRAKENPVYAFHGVPEWLIWDAGSANVSKPIAKAVDALDVKTHVHMPGAPRVKGAVEVANNIVETCFESRLRFQPVDSVDELNAAVENWVALYNADQIEGIDCRLNRRGTIFVRLDAWLTIRPEQLRELPVEAEELLTYQPETRKVGGDLTVTCVHPRLKQRCVYKVGGLPGVRVGATVEIQPLLMDEYGALRVRHTWEGEPVTEVVWPEEIDEFGQPVDGPVWGESYQQNKDTYVDMISKRLENLTGPGTVPLEDFNGGAGMRAIDAITDKGSPVLPFPRRGTVIDTNREPVGPPLNHVEAAKYLKTRLGADWEPELFGQIKRLFPDGATERELDGWLDELQGGHACAR